MTEVPEVRHFVACEDIQATDGGRHCTLHQVFQALRPRAGDSFPLFRPLTCLYTVLANGRGGHTFQVIVVRGFGPLEVVVRASATFTQDLGQDPLVVHGLPIRLPNLVFREPGQHELRLLCGGQVIARELIDVRA